LIETKTNKWLTQEECDNYIKLYEKNLEEIKNIEQKEQIIKYISVDSVPNKKRKYFYKLFKGFIK
jgi:hypothetical protein